MKLTNVQKKKLIADGNHLKPVVLIGREGFTEKVIRFIEEAFNKKELIKIKLLDSAPVDPDEIIGQIALLENTALVQKIGRTLLLFRPLPEEA